MPPPPPPLPSPSSSGDEATSSSPEPEAGPAPPPTPPPTPPGDVSDENQSRDSATNTPNCPFLLQGHCPSGQACPFVHDEFVAWLQERQELTLPEIDTPPAQSQDTSPQVAPPIETNGAAVGAATGAAVGAATGAAAVPAYGAAAIVTYGAAATAVRDAAAIVAAEAAAVAAARAAARAAAEAAKANPPVVRRPQIVGSTCRSVAVSWPKPGKVAILGYGSLNMAKDECSKFNGHSIPAGQRKKVCGHEVAAILSSAARPAEAPQTTRVSHQVAVFFGPSVQTTNEKLRRSIRKNLTPTPRHVRMGEYSATEGETIAAVRSLLAAIAPLELFQVQQDSTKTRLEATAWFPDLVAALEASRRLDKTCLSFCAEAELSVRVHNINDTCSFRCHKRR